MVRLAQRRHLVQSDRLVVDGTVIKAWASMKTRHIVERAFGWIKGPGRMRQTVFRGTEKVEFQFKMYCIANNLRRMATG